MNNQKIATEWRKKFDKVGDGGVVVIFQDEVSGWMNKLRDPEGWEPGCIAIDERGNQWESRGGDPYHGAKRWEPISTTRPEAQAQTSYGTVK